MTLLTICVNKLDKDDWEKLKQVLKYIKGKRELKLTLSAGEMSVVEWRVDDLYSVHKYFRGHKVYIMSLGKGVMSSLSKKI